MSIDDLAILYFFGGAVCALAVWRIEREEDAPSHVSRSMRGARRLSSVLLTFALWPLWAPFVLVGKAKKREADIPSPAPNEQAQQPRAGRPGYPAAPDVAMALRLAVEAAVHTPFEATLRDEVAQRLGEEVERVLHRLSELERVLSLPEFELAAAQARIDVLSQGGSTLSALRAARVHHGNVRRLEVLRNAQQVTLDELYQLLTALRGQLLVARFAGQGTEAVGTVLSDLWARLEGMGEVLAVDLPSVVPAAGDVASPQPKSCHQWSREQDVANISGQCEGEVA